MLANISLFTHPADTKQHYPSFGVVCLANVSQILTMSWKMLKQSAELRGVCVTVTKNISSHIMWSHFIHCQYKNIV